MDRVFTADGPGVVTSTDSRQGVTWLCIEGAAFSGWYPGHEVTADIGDPGRYVTTPEDFPAPNKGTKLPYNPKPRDRFKDELNIQPTHDLNPNLEPTNSIDSIRNYEPNAVFGSRHPFAKQRHARHFATDTSDDDETGFDDEKDLDFDHVPGNEKDWNPGITDYGPDYDAKNPMVVNPADGWVRDNGGKFHHPVKGGGDGPFKTSGSGYDNFFTCLDCGGNGYNYGRQCHTCQGSGVVKDSRRHAEFTEDGLPEGWNDKATPEELDNPFTREHDVIDPSNRGGGWGDHGDPHEPGDLDHAFEDDDEQGIDHPFEDMGRHEAGWGEKFERFWLGDDYDWMTGITDTSQDKTQPMSGSQGYRPETNDAHQDDRTLTYARTAAGMGMLNDTDADNMSNSTLIDPAQGLPDLQQLPMDPSHTMTPDGDMQVFSPDQGQGNDLAGAIQNALGDGQDELQGVPVPHEPDANDELAGIPVPHIPGGGSTLPVPAGAGDEINPTNVESTGNMPVGPNADDQLAHMASEFLRRTAGKDYSEGEQNLLMHEMGQASQLPALNLVGSIYEDDDEGSILGF